MKRKRLVQISCILIALLFLGYGLKEEPEIEQKIVFVNQYLNYSDTYINQGFFIDRKGNKIFYDLSKHDRKYADCKELLQYLEGLEYETSDVVVSEMDLMKYYKLLYKIDLNYTISEKSCGADQGSNAFYGIVYDKNQSPIMVLIKENGDWIRENTDPNAIKIREEGQNTLL